MTSSKEPGGVRAILKDIFAKKKAVAPAVADRYLKDQIINVLADNIGPFDKGLIRLKLIKGCGLSEDALDARAEAGFFGADVLFHALQEMIADGEIKIARGDGLFTGDDPVYYCLADNETQPEAKETSMQSESEIKTAKDMPAHEAVRARNRKIADIIKETMADGKSMTSAEIAHVLLEKGAIANSDMLDAALYDMVVKSAFLKFDDKAGTYRLVKELWKKDDKDVDPEIAAGNPEGVARELLSAFSDDDLKQEIKRRCEKAAELEAHYVAALRKKGFAGSVLILKYSNLGDETMNVDDFSQALSIPEGADRVAALKAFRDYLDENIAKHSQE